MTIMKMDYSELRVMWEPAPGSRLALALDKAEEVAEQWQAIRNRVGKLQSERAAVQAELDAVTLDSDMSAVSAAIGKAQALDLAIMRGKQELNRHKVPNDTAAGDVETIIGCLLQAERPIDDAKRRWGESSEAYQKAQRARAIVHMRYLATPERAPA
jgi:hypothetical protein